MSDRAVAKPADDPGLAAGAAGTRPPLAPAEREPRKLRNCPSLRKDDESGAPPGEAAGGLVPSCELAPRAPRSGESRQSRSRAWERGSLSPLCSHESIPSLHFPTFCMAVLTTAPNMTTVFLSTLRSTHSNRYLILCPYSYRVTWLSWQFFFTNTCLAPTSPHPAPQVKRTTDCFGHRQMLHTGLSSFTSLGTTFFSFVCFF